VVYGVPASNLLSSASVILPHAAAIPPIPEIAFAKRNDQYGAAKIGIFAYHRETKEPVWHAGIAQSRSTSKDVWLLGAGPFQRGSIYDAPRFAGSKMRMPLVPRKEEAIQNELVEFREEAEFPSPTDLVHEPKAQESSDPPLPDFVLPEPPQLPTAETLKVPPLEPPQTKEQ
jgi:hypothetical protein